MTTRMADQHLSAEWIEAQMKQLAESPKDAGILERIVLRPAENRRETPPAVEVTRESGVHGDRWSTQPGVDRSGQVSMMNSRFLKTIAGDEEAMPLAGDNLLVDLDLSIENLPAGTQLRIGTAQFEVTDQPHTGCHKFKRRYGNDAFNVVNCDEHRSKRLRGLYLRVVEGGRIRVGDAIHKV